MPRLVKAINATLEKQHPATAPRCLWYPVLKEHLFTLEQLGRRFSNVCCPLIVKRHHMPSSYWTHSSPQDPDKVATRGERTEYVYIYNGFILFYSKHKRNQCRLCHVMPHVLLTYFIGHIVCCHGKTIFVSPYHILSNVLYAETGPGCFQFMSISCIYNFYFYVYFFL